MKHGYFLVLFVPCIAQCLQFVIDFFSFFLFWIFIPNATQWVTILLLNRKERRYLPIILKMKGHIFLLKGNGYLLYLITLEQTEKVVIINL